MSIIRATALLVAFSFLSLMTFHAKAAGLNDAIPHSSRSLEANRTCPTPQPQPPFLSLKVRKASCQKGARVARTYLNADRCHPGGCKVGTFRCFERQTAYEAYRVYCRSGGRIVGFTFGF